VSFPALGQTRDDLVVCAHAILMAKSTEPAALRKAQHSSALLLQSLVQAPLISSTATVKPPFNLPRQKSSRIFDRP
jgi:hypothetical protein